MYLMTIKQLVTDSFQNAKDKGWHDPGMEKTVGDDIALMHSELSEALEDFRSGRGVGEVYYERYVISEKWVKKLGDLLAAANVPDSVLTAFSSMMTLDTPKPCGIPIELADVMIRIFDFCGKHGIDLEDAVQKKMAYNATRPHRHGGKKLLLVHDALFRVTTQRMEVIPIPL